MTIQKQTTCETTRPQFGCFVRQSGRAVEKCLLASLEVLSRSTPYTVLYQYGVG